MIEAVLKMLKKIADFSNWSIVKNTGGLFFKKSSEIEVEWIGKSKTRLPDNKYKVFYQCFLQRLTFACCLLKYGR